MSWIDSHCHLDFDAFNNHPQLFQQLEEAGCLRVMVPAISLEYFQRLIEFSIQHKDKVDIALGLHPYFIAQHSFSDLDVLDQQLEFSRPSAVGEIGLDFMLTDTDRDKQLYLFEQQVKLAIKHQLPIIVHCRKAHDQVASLVRKLSFKNGGIIHAFSGSLQQAQNYIELGFVLGLGGALTFDRAKAMHKMVAALPDGSFVLETDSPDMSPAFAQGEMNTPLNIPRIAQCISSIRQQSLESIYEQTTTTYNRIVIRR